MVTPTRAEKQLTSQLEGLLAKENFVRTAPYRLSKRRPNGVSWHLSVGARKDRDTQKVFVTIVAGIRFQALDALLGFDGGDIDLVTIAAPIHLLHDDHTYLEWDAEEEKTLEVLFEEVRTYAIPFFERYESLPNLLEAVRSHDSRKWFSLGVNARAILLIALLAYFGHSAEALRLIDREIELRNNRPIPHRLPFERMRQKVLKGATLDGLLPKSN